MSDPVRWICRFVALAVVMSTTACGAGSGPDARATVRDSAGVTIVETREPAWTQGEGWRLSAEPAIQLGTLTGPLHEQLHNVNDVARLRDGRIIVANGGSGEIRIFDAEGGFVRAFGGEGGGPGEFRSLRSVHVVGDTLVAYDSRFRRVTRFDLDGRLLGTVRIDERVSVGTRFPQVPAWLRDGGLLLFGRAEQPEAVETLQRSRAALLRFAASGTLLDTLAVVPGLEVASWEGGGRAMVAARVPFSREPVVAAGGDGVYVGTQERREVGVYDPSGGLEQLIRWRGPSLEIDGDDRERWDRSYVEHSTQSEAAKRMILRTIEPAPIPDRRPAYWDIRVDAAGHLWVAEYGFHIPGLEPTRWRVFDPDGRLLGVVDVPDRFRVHQIGEDFLLGVRRDARDVEYVSLYRIRKPSAP